MLSYWIFGFPCFLHFIVCIVEKHVCPPVFKALKASVWVEYVKVVLLCCYLVFLRPHHFSAIFPLHSEFFMMVEGPLSKKRNCFFSFQQQPMLLRLLSKCLAALLEGMNVHYVYNTITCCETNYWQSKILDKK